MIYSSILIALASFIGKIGRLAFVILNLQGACSGFAGKI